MPACIPEQNARRLSRLSGLRSWRSGNPDRHARNHHGQPRNRTRQPLRSQRPQRPHRASQRRRPPAPAAAPARRDTAAANPPDQTTAPPPGNRVTAPEPQSRAHNDPIRPPGRTKAAPGRPRIRPRQGGSPHPHHTIRGRAIYHVNLRLAVRFHHTGHGTHTVIGSRLGRATGPSQWGQRRVAGPGDGAISH
jgi:hypothetical protein